MIPISKCRGDRDLGLCTTLVLAFGGPMRSGDFRTKTCLDAGKIEFCHCAAVLQTQVPKLCTDLDLSLRESPQRTSRVTEESAGALHDGANVARTETGNWF